MATSLWEAREQRSNNRFTIWIATFESDAKRDWEDMQGRDEEGSGSLEQDGPLSIRFPLPVLEEILEVPGGLVQVENQGERHVGHW